MSSAFIFFIVVSLILVVTLLVIARRKPSEAQSENEIDTSVRRPWTRSEFVILAFYVLYEKNGLDNDPVLIETIASGMCRSVASVSKKISIFNTIETAEEHHHVLEQEVYYYLKELGKDNSEKVLDDAVVAVVEMAGQ